MSCVASERIALPWRERTVQVEYTWVQGSATPTALCVMLHEGLGSLRMWKDFPQQLCQRMGWRGLVYSRPGYGGSSARARDEHWGCDFMHHQAFEVLPALLQALKVAQGPLPVWLLGHSDGASIALLYASRYGSELEGCIALAPHVMVESITVESIALARQAYLDGDLRTRLQRYHDDVDSTFWGWNNIWLHPDFRTWSIESEIAAIRCPLLLIQGQDDEYGTLEQLRRVQSHIGRARTCVLPNCGHSPHRDAPDAVLQAIDTFYAEHRSRITP